MKIAIGCDHAAYSVKEEISNFVSSLGHKIIDCGTFSDDSVDYPLYGHKVGINVRDDIADMGIVICGSGIGISIAANKIENIRAALCTSVEHAVLSRQHNDANVLALGARITRIEDIKDIIKSWLTTDFDGGRHLVRINLIEKNSYE